MLTAARWRLLITSPSNGALNMAIDQAIGEAVRAGSVLPTLRFYAWDPPCISIGQSQSADIVDLTRCAQRGWQLVRRTTGGRTVLHHDELTYSITAPQTDPRLKGGVLESYQRLSTALQVGLSLAGITTMRVGQAYEATRSDAACFNTASAYELLSRGKKLIGSAQVRSRNIVLQHGSIPLAGDIATLADGLALTAPQRDTMRRRLQQQATTLADSAERSIDSAELIEHLRQGFATTLNINFVSSQLSDAEQARAAQLCTEKFANAAWTYRK